MAPSNPSSDDRRPVLDKEDGHWVLKVWGVGPVRIPIADRALATHVWQAATQAYNNGRHDVRETIKNALGVS